MSEPTSTVLSVPEWDLGDRLRKSLRHAGVGPGEMADYLELSRNTVTNWLGGRTHPPASAVKLWSMRTGVPYEWLAHGIGDQGCAIRDSNPEPAGLSHEPLTPADILAFRKSIGHTGVIRSSVRSEKSTR